MIYNRIWNELCTTKKNDYYLSLYLEKLRSRKKVIAMIRLIVALAGITLNTWFKNASIITLSLLTIFEFLKEIIPVFSIDEKLIDRLPEYRMLNVTKFEQLDRVFMDLISDKISDAEAKDIYNNIREIDRKIEELDNALHLPEEEKLFAKAEAKAKIHMDNMYTFEIEN